MGKEYFFDKNLYMYEGNQYFALAAAELLDCPICIRWNRDCRLGEGRNQLPCHSYVKLGNDLFLDAFGIFRHLSERQNWFGFNSSSVVECSKEQAKESYKTVKIPCTDVNMKKNAREFLRNNLMTVGYQKNGEYHIMGITKKMEMGGKCYFLTLSYDMPNNKWSSYYHTIDAEHFVANIKKSYGFIENKNWYYKK